MAATDSPSVAATATDDEHPPVVDIDRHRTTQRPQPRQLPSRLRSGSLGSTHHALSKIELPQQQHLSSLAILVVGAPACGKSTAIQKGAKGFKLGDSAPLSLKGTIPGTSSSRSYSRRIGQTQIDSSSSSYSTLKIIEAQVDLSDVDSFQSMPETWPAGLPSIDAVLVCYDVSSQESFRPVEPLLRGYRALKLPTVVLACKTDLSWQVNSEDAYQAIQSYHNGLIEVTQADEAGRDKMRKAFDWILKAALRHRRMSGFLADSDYHNPASPDVLKSPYPWSDVSQSTTPTGSPSISSLNLSQVSTRRPAPPAVSSSRPPGSPLTPTRTRSTGDLLMESERSRSKSIGQDSSHGTHLSNSSTHSLQRSPSNIPAPEFPPNETHDSFDEPKLPKDKESRPAHWATLDELLDKLLFLAISGDDLAFINNFLLTYRRFATPRTILLAMQKRMRELDKASGDPMFACYAQMKICHLLEKWKSEYAGDFAVRGTHGALNALVKSILSKTYLLHYGSDFLPFLEKIIDLQDEDSSWSVLPDDVSDASEEYSDDDDSQPDKLGELQTASGASTSVLPVVKQGDSNSPSSSRERKPSLPLTARTNMISSGQIDSTESVSKTQLKELLRISAEINNIDSAEIAQEITRMEVEAFLAIEPRHWLKFTFTSGKKDPRSDTLVAFNEISNRLGDWVVSLILCHDRAKARARQIEKLVEIAQKLRSLSNYSALRAFVAGIHAATLDDQKDVLQSRAPDQAKNLQSWRVLLHPARAHRAYRLALRNTKGPCIPALEVHMADLIKAHEGNADTDALDPSKIHWGKFNMMGRFINSTTVCQTQCRNSLDNEYNFPAREHIKTLLNTPYLMNDEAQHARLSQLDTEYDDAGLNGRVGRENSGQAQPALLRKLFSMGR